MGIGPFTTAPVLLTVSTISFADLSMSLLSKAFRRILIFWLCKANLYLNNKIFKEHSEKIGLLHINTQKSGNSMPALGDCQ